MHITYPSKQPFVKFLSEAESRYNLFTHNTICTICTQETISVLHTSLLSPLLVYHHAFSWEEMAYICMQGKAQSMTHLARTYANG